MQRRIFCAAIMGGGALLTSGAGAQSRSDVQRLLVGFPPGGIADVVSRLVANVPSEGRSTVVENLPGASGRIAIGRLRQSVPDGSVALLSLNSAFTIYPYVYKKLGYDPVNDFVPVGSLGSIVFVYTVSTAVVPDSVKTLAQLKAFYAANPQAASFGTGGAGTVMHFAGLNVAKTIGVELQHVPYKGGAPLFQDLLGGQISSGVTVLGETLPHLATGKVRAIAVMSGKRSRFAPDIPTFAELGAPNLVAEEGFGIFLPKGASQQSVGEWNKQMHAAMTTSEAQQVIQKAAFDVNVTSAEQYRAFLDAERVKWKPLVLGSGYSMDE